MRAQRRSASTHRGGARRRSKSGAGGGQQNRARVSPGQSQAIWIQAAPIGAQMPQLLLQQYCPDAQVFSPHVTGGVGSTQ
jgi:hypothetical protein